MNNVKKSIGWCDWTINPVKGLCPVGCSYCYARRAYGRNCNATFKDKSIRYDSSVFVDLYKAKPGERVFVGSTIDLFHPLCSAWNNEILSICKRTPELTFIFLTKCPENLPKEFPENCWVGCSVPDFHHYYMTMKYLPDIKAPVRFISFEPLLEKIGTPGTMFFDRINWAIIGQQTPVSKKTAPKIEWIDEIISAAHSAKIPIFLKDNLIPLFTGINKSLLEINGGLRQEFPLLTTPDKR